jgi:hypothetical protein
MDSQMVLAQSILYGPDVRDHSRQHELQTSNKLGWMYAWKTD